VLMPIADDLQVLALGQSVTQELGPLAEGYQGPVADRALRMARARAGRREPVVMASPALPCRQHWIRRFRTVDGQALDPVQNRRWALYGNVEVSLPMASSTGMFGPVAAVSGRSPWLVAQSRQHRR
jgi:hypothetical protein